MAALFGQVRYYISVTLADERRTQLAAVLDAHAATAVPLADATLTHFVTATLPSDDGLEILPADSRAHLVTPYWIERARALGVLPSPAFFSPDPALLFSGLTATAVGLSPPDLELLSAAISALGGQWRTALTRDVTHLFALSPGSAKYETAMHYRDMTGMCILVPHWFDDSVRLGIRGLPTAEYEWPEPRVFMSGTAMEKPVQDAYKMPKEKRAFYETALASSHDLTSRRASSHNVWNGLRILLGASLDLSESQRDAHEADIRREGGVVVPLATFGDAPSKVLAEETQKVDEADVLVTRCRSGPSYVKAYRLNKTIGSLSWLWYVRSSGVLCRPTDQLLHYPIPKKPIENFSSHIITITNYTGKDREYLKKLVVTMGAEFTASMTGKNTVVIAAYISGTKTTKAVSWSIPTVNHTWLEDCFVQWRALTPACEKYMCFPPGIDFSRLLARRGTGRIGLEAGELEGLGTQEEQGEVEEQLGVAGVSAGASVPAPAGTANSAREVEDAVGAHMDVDAGDDGAPAVGEQDDGMDVDGERGRHKEKAEMTRQREPDAEAGSAARAPPRNVAQRYSRRAGGRPPVLEMEEDAEDDTREGDVSPVRPVKSRRDKRKKNAADGDHEEGRSGGSEAGWSPKQGRAAKGQRKPPRRVFSSDDDFDVEMAASPQLRKGSHKPKKTVVRSDTEPEQDDVDDDEEDVQPRRATRATASRNVVATSVQPSTPPRTTASPAKSSRTPGRQVSVVLPTAAAVYSSPSKRASASPSKPVTRTDSLRAKAAEVAGKSPSKGGRPSDSAPTPRSPSPPPTKHRRRGSGPEEASAAGPSRLPSSPGPAALTRTPSKRSAASKATQKLRDVVMPDMNNFQREMRKGAVRSTWEGESPSAHAAANAKRGEAGQEAGASKAAHGERAKGKKRASLAAEDDAVASDEEPDRKRQRTGASAKKSTAASLKGGRRRSLRDGQSASPEQEDELSDDEGSQVRRKPGSKATGKSGASLSKSSGGSQSNRTNAKNVRIMTTQVSVSDDVTKALTRLGCKFTTKPAECTHLVAKSIVRTEKFLCAMAVAPFIVSERWLVACAATRRVLPGEDFALSDAGNEKKYGFRLVDALQRAKENGGRLFAGMTFYVTPKVVADIDIKLMKNVVSAGGGSVVTQTPTMRVLNGNENRYVVSDERDISIWRPLAQQGHPIYSSELILSGALKQEINWDNPNNRVKGTV